MASQYEHKLIEQLISSQNAQARALADIAKALHRLADRPPTPGVNVTIDTADAARGGSDG